MHSSQQEEFSLKNFFIPLTTLKAIHIITILAFIVFGNMLFNEFVWDDVTYIQNNPQVHDFNVSTHFGPNLFNTGGQYRPFIVSYFSLMYSLFHNSTFFYHFIQLVLHIVNTSLLFILFSKFFNKPLSLFLALIFLIHPMQVESVSYIATSGNQLFFLFGISALLLSLEKQVSTKRLLCIFALLFLALLTRETGILFFVVIILYRLLFLKTQIAQFLLYGAGVVGTYLLMRFLLAGMYLEKVEIIPIARLPFFERLLNIPAVVVYYFKTFLYPVQLSIQQYWIVERIDFISFYLPLFILLFLAALLVLLGRKIKKENKKAFSVFLFFVAWFISGLGLHSQLFPLDLTVSDRWFFFPMVGLLGIIGLGMQSLHLAKKHVLISVIIASVILSLLAVRTIVRNINWHDPITLYTHDRQIHTNFDTENNLGYHYSLEKNYAASINHYQKSVELFPHEGNYFNLGVIYEQIGDKQKAEEAFMKALQHKNYIKNGHEHDVTTYERLGWILVLTKDPMTAKKFLQTALKDHPESPKLWLMLSLTEYKDHNTTAAITAAKKAKQLAPNDNEVQYLYDTISKKEPVTIYDNNAPVTIKP